MDFDAELGQDIVELGEGAAVEIIGGDDLVSCLAEVDYGIKDCTGARCQSQCRRAAFQFRHAFFQDVLRGVHDPGVDIAQLFEGKEVGCVFGIAEYIGTGAVDRYGSCFGFCVGFVSTV